MAPSLAVPISRDEVSFVRSESGEHSLENVGPSIEVEQYTVAMTLVTFLVILATALMYQGAVSSGGLSGFFVAGLTSIAAAIVIAFLARRHFIGRLVTLSRQSGLSEEEATALARRDLARVSDSFDRGTR